MKRISNKKNLKGLRICKAGMIAIALTWSASTWAQPTLPDDYVTFQEVGETVDTVTVGSRMAYKVRGDAVIAAMPASIMNPSYFKWEFSPALTIKSFDGTTDLTDLGSNYYAEKEISVVMPSSTGTMTLKIAEKSRPVVGTGCESADSTANIVIVAKPTLQWPSTKVTGGCVDADIDIALTLTGYKDWVVTYDVLYTDYISATTSTKASNQTATIGSEAKLTIASTVFDQPGKYEIKVTNLTDRISRKSLDQDLVKAIAGTNIPAATDMYTVHAYPTPKTHKLEHVKNL
ncbi:MAG: hypothetical protein LBS03_09910 [Bacteroidales bacterium]|jgi:hypothetical protein|nr:hypothetical protein [Bacteroidales bacterium]